MRKNSWWKQSGVARRDERASKDTPETSSKGKRGGKSRPWIVEYRLPKSDANSFMWKHDGEWHTFWRRYADAKSASQAMDNNKRKYATDRTVGMEWRIRNTEES